MNIQQLNLLAFGPFTERTLDFASKKGLHIIYGPNEAGKSSSLRGLKALLFGINPRTKDNHLHENRALLIGGTVQNQNGDTLVFRRRKGNKKTLQDTQGNPLEDTALSPFLHGVSADIFDTLFGIDYQSLLHGGEEILEQKGEVGQALFSASTGSANLARVLQQLEKEAEELFKPNGSTPAVNAAIKSYNETKKTITERSLSFRDWDDAHASVERASAALQQTQDELSELKKQQHRLLRIERSLPGVVERNNCLAQMQGMGSVTILSDDFDKRRQSAVNALHSAQEAAEAAVLRKAALQAKADEITVNRPLLAQKSLIEDLHARLGALRQALNDRPALQAEKTRHHTNAEVLLKGIRPDLELVDAGNLHAVMARRAEISELAVQRQALMERCEQYNTQAAEFEKACQTARKDLEKLPPPAASLDSLAAQLNTSQKVGDIDTQIEELLQDSSQLSRECEIALSALGSVWQGTLDDALNNPWPSNDSVTRFEQTFRDLETTTTRLREKHQVCADSVRDARRELDEIHHIGEVPSESDLTDARGGRDTVWELLYRQWVNGDDISSEVKALAIDSPLPQVFETRIVQADDLSDRLRRETGRVQKQAQVLAQMTDSEKQIAVLERELTSAAATRAQLEDEWQQLWQPVSLNPLSPGEMRSWLERLQRLNTQITELEKVKLRLSRLEQTRGDHIDAVAAELAQLGHSVPTTKTLAKILTEAEILAGRLSNTEQARDTLTRRIAQLEDDIAAANASAAEATSRLQTWRAQWAAAIAGLGLDADAIPAKVIDMLDSIKSLFDELKDFERLSDRLIDIETNERSYKEALDDLVERVKPELRGQPIDQSVTQLMASLEEAAKREANLQQLSRQIEEASEDIAQAAATTQTMTARIEALCEEAKCIEHSALEEAARRSSDYLRLRRIVERREKELLEIGKGMELDALTAEVSAVDPDTLEAELEFLRSQIDNEVGPKLTDLASIKGEKSRELALMDGGNDSALLAEEAQSHLENIRANAEKYAQLKLAAKILRDQIERYRRENQGPMLNHASAHFAALTLGSFVELQADLDEKDNPVLVGIRASGQRVYVEGMSSGTRDQLYLALRLAALEKYMDSVEPMPFIVDDILVHFDDERTEATLKVLATLAERTQIILFTHHARLLDQAKALPDNKPFIHIL